MEENAQARRLEVGLEGPGGFQKTCLWLLAKAYS